MDRDNDTWMDWFSHLSPADQQGMQREKKKVQDYARQDEVQAAWEEWQARLAQQGFVLTRAGKLRKLKVKPEEVRP